MNDTPEIRKYKSLRRFLLEALIGFGGTALTILTIWGLFILCQQKGNGIPMKLLILGIGAGVFYSWVGIWIGTNALARLVIRRPLLVVNADGIWENGTSISALWIPWTDITLLETGGIYTKRRVAIHVRDAEQTLSQQKLGPIGRSFRRLEFAKRGNRCPYGIPVPAGPTAAKELLDEIQKFYDLHVRDVGDPGVEFRYSQPSATQVAAAGAGKRQLVAGILKLASGIALGFLGLWMIQQNVLNWLGAVIGLGGGLLGYAGIGAILASAEESRQRRNVG